VYAGAAALRSRGTFSPEEYRCPADLGAAPARGLGNREWATPHLWGLGQWARHPRTAAL